MVIKQCLKVLCELNKNDNFVKLNNIIFIGAAIQFKNKNSWKKYIESLVVGKVINCFSNCDETLKNLFKINKKRKEIALGNQFLEIQDNNKKNLISNCDFTKECFDQLSYNNGIVAMKLMETFKDL